MYIQDKSEDQITSAYVDQVCRCGVCGCELTENNCYDEFDPEVCEDCKP